MVAAHLPGGKVGARQLLGGRFAGFSCVATLAASLGYPAVFIATAGVLTLLGLWVIGLVREPVSSPT